jgi:cupin fold WbuC family metalloprotein
MEPGSYIQPHRHYMHPKIELFFALRGSMALVVFSDTGEIELAYPLSAGGDLIGAEVPPGAWHTVVSLSEGSVFLEVKPGPYEPLTAKDRAPWAPEEGTPEAMPYLESLVKAGEANTDNNGGIVG